MLDALREKRFFKLILGGSLTDTSSIVQTVSAYVQAGIDCLDIAAEPVVVACVAASLKTVSAHKPKPTVMVSVPLDPDPHFRKIALDAEPCIDCGICIPECPSDALSLPERTLTISQPLCYGCGRCVPVCPTEALSLLPFKVESTMLEALSHPIVEAVEIHSHYCDAGMLEAFLEEWKMVLSQKILSLCFRVHQLTDNQIVAFYQVAEAFSVFPVIIQVDGVSMSGNVGEDNSLPALQGAQKVKRAFQEKGLAIPLITLAGGISGKTAPYLSLPEYSFISGVAAGTAARQLLNGFSGQEAVERAKAMLQLFQKRSSGFSLSC